MNRKFTMLTALLLAVLTIASCLASCGGDGGTSKPGETTPRVSNGDAETTTAAEEVTYDRAHTPDALPADLDFDGQTLTFIYRDYDILRLYQMEGENNGGDVLYDAVYTRNQTVMDRLNVDFKYVYGPADDKNSHKIKDEIPKAILSGDAPYDIVILSAQFGFTHSLLGYYIDLMDFPYVDVDQPWWWKTYMETESIDTTKRYMLNGDYTLYALMSATSAYFNKDMFTNVFGDTEQLYTLVEDGAWTVDRYLEYCAGAYRDVNGDGQRDEDDVYGTRHTSIFTGVNYLTLSCGLEMSTRDSDGLPVLDIYNENWIKWSEMLKRYMMTDEYSKIGTGGKSTIQYFINQGSLFSMDMLYNANQLRDTEFAYGIVPFPKFTEAQNYLSAGATPNADAVFIPVTTDPALYDAIGASLEALSAESYRTITETYYETTLKGKYLENERDLQMVDIIYNNIGTCFVMVAGVELGAGAISSMFVYCLQKNDGNLTSYYDANKVAFDQYMTNMIEKYQNLTY